MGMNNELMGQVIIIRGRDYRQFFWYGCIIKINLSILFTTFFIVIQSQIRSIYFDIDIFTRFNVYSPKIDYIMSDKHDILPCITR